MRESSFDELVEKALAADQRYEAGAYHFVREALDYTQQKIKRADRAARIKPESPENLTEATSGKKEEGNHVSGQELLDGAREYALQSYGPMAMTLFEMWGLKSCEDIGEIVFNMVKLGGLNKRDTDSLDDFKGGYNFEETFRKPFTPANRISKSPTEPKGAE